MDSTEVSARAPSGAVLSGFLGGALTLAQPKKGYRAGMDAALVSVLGGLTPLPVVAVPTSVGYGAAQGGQAALWSMLASCAPGICVMNIDNGYGAACACARILGRVNG